MRRLQTVVHNQLTRQVATTTCPEVVSPAEIEAWQLAELLDAQKAILPHLPERGRRRALGLVGPAFASGLLGLMWYTPDRKTYVKVSVQSTAGHGWLHVSVAHTDRMPTYSLVAKVRRAFFLDEALVVQVSPPVAEHVDIHPYMLHLWQRLDGERLVPDLRGHDPHVPHVGLAI